jgi:exosome complex component RRP4
MELVTPGQTITSEPGFLRGHGTYVLNGNLIASVAGVVQRVNKVGILRKVSHVFDFSSMGTCQDARMTLANNKPGSSGFPQLISVIPIKSRYSGQVGDVIVGRVLEVGQKRWNLDVNASQVRESIPVPETHT